MSRSPEYRYYGQAARRAGVPLFWVEDAVQDIALRVWRARTAYWKRVVAYAAVDAARRYGARSRRGVERTPITLDNHAQSDDTATRIALMDVRAALPLLSPCQRLALARRLRGERVRGTPEFHLARARKRLRRLTGV